MIEPITETEVETWFRCASPKSWAPPLAADVRDLAELLTRLLGQPVDAEDDWGRPDRWKKVKAAAATLSAELPAVQSLARASAHQASREGVEGEVSAANLANLAQLELTLKALRTVFETKLLQPTDPDPPRVNNRWHALARLLAHQARGAWANAGVRRVGYGNNEESPVVKFVQLALARAGEAHEKGAIVKVLKKWNRSGAQG